MKAFGSAEEDIDVSITEHLRALRSTLLRSAIGFGVAFLLTLIFLDPLFNLMRVPIDRVAAIFPEGTLSLTMIRPAELFMTKLKVACFAAFVVSLPNTLMQVWLFLAPGLYAIEQSRILRFVGLGFGAFILGAWLAYAFAFEIFFNFFVGDAVRVGVDVMLSVDEVFRFMLRILWVFGFIFQTPMVVFVMTRSGMLSREILREFRPYIFLGGAVVGAILTPPDVISQLVVGGLLVLFVELGVILARVSEGLSPQKQK